MTGRAITPLCLLAIAACASPAALSSASVAPGCADVGAGVAVPTTAAGYDHDGLVRCMVRVKGAIPELAAETRVTIAANPGVDFATVAAVIDELRMHDGADLFPEVQFGIAR